MTVGDALWKKILGVARSMNGAHVKVGVLSDQEHGDDAIGNVELAATHEFGSPAAGIPERSFIRRALAWNSGPWLPSFTAKLVARVVAGQLDELKALEILGQRCVAEVRRTITAGLVEPRLEDSAAGRRTIARKGSSKTLVETGQMLNSISYEVFGR